MKALLAMLLLAGSTLTHALPDAVRQERSDWRQWGSGEMSWFGIALYRATLWVAAQPGANPPVDAPSALQLDYRRDIPRERLVESSVDEMRRLGASEAQLQRWQRELQRVLPDVREGETVVGVHYPGQGAVFFHRGRLNGEVADAEFARLFFAIWLDERSRSPALRAALLTRPER
ncbi:MAG: chalcone isomerase family protein [Candidatus Accumulibacter sp.]|nr:chalcone isomerase family protein [Accumulibacter sp.]